jgi:hypothetical protein
MEAMPREQVVVAVATYVTLVLTVLWLTGEVTWTADCTVATVDETVETACAPPPHPDKAAVSVTTRQ